MVAGPGGLKDVSRSLYYLFIYLFHWTNEATSHVAHCRLLFVRLNIYLYFTGA